MQKRRITAVAVTAATILATTVAVAGSASAATKRTHLNSTKPTWTAHAAHLGRASKTAGVSARVYLAPRGGIAAAERAAYAVSTHGSAGYHRFLTSAQYQKRFAPTAASVSAVSKFVRSSGLKVTSVEAHNRYVAVSGTVAAAETAFGVSIERYRHDAQNVQAPSGALSVPSTLASSILTISGLDTTVHLSTPTGLTDGTGPVPDGFRNAQPCSSYYGEKTASTLPKFNGKTLPYAICGYTGNQLHSAYVRNSPLTGAGTTIGIIDAYSSPTIVTDINTYAANGNESAWAPGQFSKTLVAKTRLKKQCGPAGWFGEETLDIEAVHAIAPGAGVHFYGGASCADTDLDDALAYVLDQDSVDAVSNSYGDNGEGVPQDEVLEFHALAIQAAMQGISLMFSSGDNGDEVAVTGTKQADFSATDPLVTAVGGTATEIGKSGTVEGTTGWGTVKYSLSSDNKSWTDVGFLYGSGGGESVIYKKPSYQRDLPGTGRQVPDVAMDGDVTTGMLIGITQSFPEGVHYDQYKVGGTSLASPLFAGMTALTMQHAGTRSGFLNPVIYANRGRFTDVTGPVSDPGNVRSDFVNGVDASGGVVYSVRTFDQDSSLTVTPGWDNVTGLGVPTTRWFTVVG